MEVFSGIRQEHKAYIDRVINLFLPEGNEPQRKIYEAMSYSVLAGGKRLRPMLMLSAYNMFEGDDREIVEPFMTAIELIHTYSLVHDDLPAMDNDEYRRGRKTTHAVYGEALGILAGDALLNYAFETACRAFQKGKHLERIARAVSILGKKSGIQGMLGGQVVDMEGFSERLTGATKEELKRRLDYMYQLKTGALLEASLTIGAVLAGATDVEIDKMEQLGGIIGLAFQIQDDILDVTSTTEVLGKPVLSDEKNNKLTYVSLLGIDKSREEVEALTKKGLLILKNLNGDSAFLEELLVSLVNREF